MPKNTATAEELQAEIARRIAAHRTCSGCKAPMPKPADRAFYLANWKIDPVPPEVPGCSEVITAIVRDVMIEYDLAD